MGVVDFFIFRLSIVLIFLFYLIFPFLFYHVYVAIFNYFCVKMLIRYFSIPIAMVLAIFLRFYKKYSILSHL